LRVLVSKLACAIAKHLSPKVIAKLGVVDELNSGKVEELIALQDD
jgi:hypothetical protein